MGNKMIKSTMNKGITIPSLVFITSVSLLAAIFPAKTNTLLNGIKQFIFVNLNWVYVWAVTIFVVFLVYLMLSKYGNIKLGRNDSQPEYSFFSWISMLFAAGMGIGLMYFSVAEPMQHYSNEIFAGETVVRRAKNAQLYTFFHWGIHAWAIYGVVGLTLAYFAYRYRLPLSLRSCLYPLLKDKINGRWGNLIDIFALCSTFFGITTTLGFGVVQINSGLQVLNIVPETNFTWQVAIVGVLVGLSIISAVTGLDKGVRILSNINIVSVIALLVFVLFLGPTVYLIGSFTEGLGHYINSFFDLTFSTHVYDKESLPWFYDWTILYWAWWISWSPYVGLFIARISKGRTIKEFIGAVLILPTLFNFIWMSVFGNSAIWFDANVAGGALSQLANNADALMFKFFEFLPFKTILSFLVIAIIMIFFVTSADSGMYVMNSIATQNAKQSPKWQTVSWGVLLAVLALVLLNAGGLGALQSMTLITALPFSLIVLLFIISLTKALAIDKTYYDREYSISTLPWSGKYWKERLGSIVKFDDKTSVDKYINEVVKIAFEQIKEELSRHSVAAEVRIFEDPKQIEIRIEYDKVNDFVYGVKNQSRTISEFFTREQNLPSPEDQLAHFPESYFGDRRPGYDVRLFTKEELISDVLKHFERFVEIVAEQRNEMFVSRNTD
jgi:choline/glycine/proline betaine transport protein